VKRRKRVFVGSLVVVASLLAAACSSSSNKSTANSTAPSSTSSSGSSSSAPNVPINAPMPSGGNGGATAPGVTADSIKTFILVEGTAAQPYQNTGAYNGAAAYYAYVNSQGGIYGRKINVTQYNDQYVPTNAEAACASAIPGSFAMVAASSAASSGCYSAVKQSGIPWFPELNLYPPYYGLPNAIVTDPYKEANGFARYMLSTSPNSTKLAVLGTNVPGEQSLIDQEAALDTSAGFTVVKKLFINTSAPNLVSYAIELKNAGVQAVDGIGFDQTTAARLAVAMGQESYDPPIKFGSGNYNVAWHQIVPSSEAAGWYEILNTGPYLNPAELTATTGGKLFSYWLNKEYPGLKPDIYTTLGWITAAEFVQGLIGAGPELTRASYLKAARAITSFNADGLAAMTNPSTSLTSICFSAAETTSTSWTIAHPTTPGTFDCTTGQYVTIPAG
jgi:branched-chain amino acid transport system substrate-binding protein